MIAKLSKAELDRMTDKEIIAKIDELIEAMKPFETKYSWEPRVAYQVIYRSYKSTYSYVQMWNRGKNVVT